MVDIPSAPVVSRIIIAINLRPSEKDLIALIIPYFTHSVHVFCYPALPAALQAQAADQRSLPAWPPWPWLSSCRPGQKLWAGGGAAGAQRILLEEP